MRHLIIGDSHVAALKLGWEQIAADHPDVSLVFAGARGHQMTKLFVDGSRLTASSRRVREQIEQLTGTTEPTDVATFDKCWIVGGRLAMMPVIRLFLNFRSEAHDDLGSDAQILSRPAWQLAESGVFDVYAGRELARSVSSLGVPVGLIPTPMRSEAAFLVDPWSQLTAPGLQSEMYGVFSRGVAAISAELGAQVYHQPAETLAAATMTNRRFSKNSFGLLRSSPHGSEDHNHMNSDYGQRVIEEHILR